MKDIRQSDQFAAFMKGIGWRSEKINSTYVYLRKLPLLGYYAKIPRPGVPFDYSVVSEIRNKFHPYQFKIAPFVTTDEKHYSEVQNKLVGLGFKTENFPFNPTNTIQIDLTQSGEKIFKNFTQAKRRAVRRALKNNIEISESNNIEEFIKIRKKQYFPLGFMVTGEMKSLWKNFYPENASVLLVYHKTKPVGGLLLLFYDKIAYYWFASVLKIGKKLFAPTLLVWEALKLAKKKGCRIFDFEGIYDERFPKASESWRGFTKFKEGFGGRKVVLMENMHI